MQFQPLDRLKVDLDVTLPSAELPKSPFKNHLPNAYWMVLSNVLDQVAQPQSRSL